MFLRTLILATVLAGSLQDDPRLPVPDAAALKESEKLIRDLFKDEYARKAPADRQQLSRKLYQQAQESKDSPAPRYVLLRESADLAAEVQDLFNCFKSYEELAKAFRVEGWKLKFAALAAASKTARTNEDSVALAGFYLRLVDEAIAGEDLETAKKSIDAATVAARKGKDLGLTVKAQSRDKELADLRSRMEKLKKARETLARTPDDGPSCLVLGQHECFVKGNWKDGLPLLAKCSDGALKDLATRDLSEPTGATAQAAVGDGWWDLSEKESAQALKQNLRQRAHAWYEKAAAALTGLHKTKVDKRLKILRLEQLHRGSWVDVSDPKMYGASGKPGDAVEATRERITPSKLPSGVFDGLFVRIRIKSGSANVIYEPERCGTWIQTVNPHIITGRFNPAEERWEPEGKQIIPVAIEEEYLLTVLLTGGEWVVYLHSEEKGRLKTTATSLTTFEFDAPNGVVLFDQMRLRRKE
jgi:hypothetical protein